MGASWCDAHKRYTRGCPGCQARAARYRRLRVAGIADGTWESGLVTGEELERVRQHVRALTAIVGVGGRRVAQVAGVSHHSVDVLKVDGATGMLRPVAEALLGVTAEACLALIDSPTIPVDPTGTMRRLRALAVDGWSSIELAGLVGVQPSAIRRHRAGNRVQITHGMHERFRLLYEKIQSLADPRGSSEASRKHAEELGWLGPERWADEDIDNPDAEPLPPPPETDDWAEVSRMIDGALRDPQPGKAREYPRHIKREIARQATTRLGWSYARVAELLGLGGPDGSGGTSAVEYLLYGRKDRPRTKELWKDGK